MPQCLRHCLQDARPPCGPFYSLADMGRIALEWGPLVYNTEPTAHPSFPATHDPAIHANHAGWLATNGYGLARRKDWAAVLEAMHTVGFRKLSFTLHGLREHHDWFTCRKGAFDDIITATQRAKAAGFGTYWQVFVDRLGIADVAPLAGLAVHATGDPLSIGIPFHAVRRRLWRYEKLRVSKTDVLAHGIHRLNDGERNGLADPASKTAAAWLERWHALPERERLTWREVPDSEQLLGPFEPQRWPPEPPFEWLALHIRRDRGVHFSPLCSFPVRLGHLCDGKELLLDRLRRIEAPPHIDLSPDDVRLAPEEEDEVHPSAFSFRYRQISKRLQVPP